MDAQTQGFVEDQAEAEWSDQLGVCGDAGHGGQCLVCQIEAAEVAAGWTESTLAVY